MKKKLSVTGLIILLSLTLMNCGTNSAGNDIKDTVENKEEAFVSENPDKQVDKTDKLCFELENKKFSNFIEIFFLDNNKVKGNFYVHVHDEDMGYETSSDSKFEGEISGDQIKVELTVEIEDNIEHESEIWEYKTGVLTINGNEYVKTECKTPDEQ